MCLRTRFRLLQRFGLLQLAAPPDGVVHEPCANGGMQWPRRQMRVAKKDLAMRLTNDGTWSWEPESVEPGTTVLAPTYRFVRPYTIVEPDGARIFIDVTDGSLLCKHGELGSTVSTWCQAEKIAAREGRPPPTRPSICDCQNANGLFTKQKNASPPTAAESTVPASIFDHLVAIDTPSVLVAGREARQLPFTSGDQASFLTPDGRIICRHGRLRSSLLRMKQRGSQARCQCMPRGIPQRRCIDVKLGRGMDAQAEERGGRSTNALKRGATVLERNNHEDDRHAL